MHTEEERLRRLYPFVDESKTPLPHCWSTSDKWNSLGVSHNNLRVTYRGQGKNHKDAAAVRTAHPIPASCGVYYFEVRIVSKGRDGYMGIGLCQKEVNMNRLPGWERASYGYHGDDGNSFCSSGSGLSYGPTFTTGDVVGCGLNLVDNTCFYTKNGQNLGVAFTDLPPDLYPTVGLQTPGEVVDTNFGQLPFVYDIEADILEAQLRVQTSISKCTLPSKKKEWMDRLIASYLVHHGFCASAESLNEATGLPSSESTASMKNRQEIKHLVLEGRMSDAICRVNQLYPGLLEGNPQLLFSLKCRKFIEMVAGVDSESPPMQGPSLSATSPPHKSSLPRVKSRSPQLSPRDSPGRVRSPRTKHSPSPSAFPGVSDEAQIDIQCENGCKLPSSSIVASSEPIESEEEMDCGGENGEKAENGTTSMVLAMEGSVGNGASEDPMGEGCDFPTARLSDSDDDSRHFPSDANSDGVHHLLQLGRDLLQFSSDLKSLSQQQKKVMQDAFSLLAYTDPWKSPMSYLLSPSQREAVASSLNSAILECQGFPGRAALETVIGHGRRLRERMATAGLGMAAFADPDALARLPEQA